MSLFTDIQAAMRSTLTAEIGARPPKDAPLGYGRDAWCTTSVTEDVREVDHDSPLGIAQLALRVLISARDSIPDAPGRGLNVRRMLSVGLTLPAIIAWQGSIKGEIEQDDRIKEIDVKVTIERSVAVPLIRVAFRITPEDARLVAFDGVFIIPETGAATVELLP